MRCPSITCARPRRAVSRGPMPAIFSPAKVTPPAFQGTRPEIARSSVVLPAPLGPSRVTTSPAPIVMSTPCSTAILPYPASSPRMSSNGSAAEIGTDDLLVHANFSRRPLRQYPTEIEHGHIITDIENQIGMMLDQKHAGTLTANRLDELPKTQ